MKTPELSSSLFYRSMLRKAAGTLTPPAATPPPIPTLSAQQDPRGAKEREVHYWHTGPEGSPEPWTKMEGDWERVVDLHKDPKEVYAAAKKHFESYKGNPDKFREAFVDFASSSNRFLGASEMSERQKVVSDISNDQIEWDKYRELMRQYTRLSDMPRKNKKQKEALKNINAELLSFAHDKLSASSVQNIAKLAEFDRTVSLRVIALLFVSAPEKINFESGNNRELRYAQTEVKVAHRRNDPKELAESEDSLRRTEEFINSDRYKDSLEGMHSSLNLVQRLVNPELIQEANKERLTISIRDNLFLNTDGIGHYVSTKKGIAGAEINVLPVNKHAGKCCHPIEHEYAHHLHHVDSEIKSKITNFFKKRTKGEQPKKYMSRDGGVSFSYYEDRWELHGGWNYSGKIPESAEFEGMEVLTCGVERLIDDPVKFAKNDPEYFDLVMSCIRRW
jgi:hypothetical protein